MFPGGYLNVLAMSNVPETSVFHVSDITDDYTAQSDLAIVPKEKIASSESIRNGKKLACIWRARKTSQSTCVSSRVQ